MTRAVKRSSGGKKQPPSLRRASREQLLDMAEDALGDQPVIEGGVGAPPNRRARESS